MKRGAAKRGVDIVASAVGLILLSPLLAAAAASIALTTGRPVLFRQTRVGLGGRPFTLVKFRTMRDTWDESGRPLLDEARLTRLGGFLRRTSLDELPEVWNVLVGDMSLVGPRPLLVEYLPLYSAHQARRHEVRPGITGLAQISGRGRLSFQETVKLDVEYVKRRSLLLDLKIVFLTLYKLVTRDGAF